MHQDSFSPLRKVPEKKGKKTQGKEATEYKNDYLVIKFNSFIETDTPVQSDSDNEENRIRIGNKEFKATTSTSVRSATTTTDRLFPESWIRYNKITSSCYCEPCTKQDVNSKWNHSKFYKNKTNGEPIRGIKRSKIDGCRNHATRDMHRNSISKLSMSKTMVNSLSKLFNKAYDDYKKIFRAALFIVKHRLSCNRFVDICNLLKEYNIRLMDNDLYVIQYSFYEIMKTFSETIIKDLNERLKKSQYYSIIVDESTDITSTKELIIYVKYYDTISGQCYWTIFSMYVLVQI